MIRNIYDFLSSQGIDSFVFLDSIPFQTCERFKFRVALCSHQLVSNNSTMELDSDSLNVIRDICSDTILSYDFSTKEAISNKLLKELFEKSKTVITIESDHIVLFYILISIYQLSLSKETL